MSAPPGFNWTTELVNKIAHQIAIFGRQVTYKAGAGQPFALSAILAEAAELEESSPGVVARLIVNPASFPQPPARGDEVTIDTVVYKVFGVEARGQGGTTLGLRLK